MVLKCHLLIDSRIQTITSNVQRNKYLFKIFLYRLRAPLFYLFKTDVSKYIFKYEFLKSIYDEK